MDHKQFLQMIESIRRHKGYSDINVTGDSSKGDDFDEVEFRVEYLSLSELGGINKVLKIRRLEVPPDSPKELKLFMDGKVICSEQKKCPTCGNVEWKNVTRELQIKLLGGNVPGW